MLTWPVDTARSMSGCLISEPLVCIVISSCPPEALFTSATKRLTLRVWNSLSLYGVGMSHFTVCAGAAEAQAVAITHHRNSRIRMTISPGSWAMLCGNVRLVNAVGPRISDRIPLGKGGEDHARHPAKSACRRGCRRRDARRGSRPRPGDDLSGQADTHRRAV